MTSPSSESYELIQQHPHKTCEHMSHKYDRLVIFAQNQTGNVEEKIKAKAYPPDKIWLRQKSPNSFESKLQSRRTISRPLRSITCNEKYDFYCLPRKGELKPGVWFFFFYTSYGVSFLNCTFTAAYFFFLRSSILLYKPSRSISKHLYFLLTWMQRKTERRLLVCIVFVRQMPQAKASTFNGRNPFWEPSINSYENYFMMLFSAETSCINIMDFKLSLRKITDFPKDCGRMKLSM